MITIDQAPELLRQAVATQGEDFVYNPDARGSCYYEPLTSRNAPPDDPRRLTGCLIGVALDLAGETRHHGHHGNVQSLVDEYPDMMDVDTVKYFGMAQNAQDDGRTWGQAFQVAERARVNGRLVSGGEGTP
jgi:hypothetical protein